jgi:hypothetical protein
LASLIAGCREAIRLREERARLAEAWRESKRLMWRDLRKAHAVPVVPVLEGEERMKIYVASSWRNLLQPGIVHALRRIGHDVYDLRNPAPGNSGFGWRQCDPSWVPGEPVDGKALREVWQHPVAVAGYTFNITALRECDAVVYVLPCGRSASWEFGYAMGQGKRGYVMQFEPQEPELMFREATMLTSMDELFDAFGEPSK